MNAIPMPGKGDNRLDVTVYDGKYTLIQSVNGGLRALRYGEEWRDLTGDGFVLALGQEVERLRAGLRELTQCDGSPENAADAEVLASRVRKFAQDLING